MNAMDQIIELISRAERPLILSHERPDGDAVGSVLGLYWALSANTDKKPTALCRDHIPRYASFLPGVELIERPDPNSLPSYLEKKGSDLLICLDTANSERLSYSWDALKGIGPTIVIDHHVSNERFGDLNWIDSEDPSASGMVYRLLRKMKFTLDARCATCIYAGVFSDTGGFRYPKTTQSVFLMAADLVAAGADPVQIADSMYNNERPEKLKLLSRALDSLRMDLDAGAALFQLTNEDFEETNAERMESHEMVNFGLSLQGVYATALVMEQRDGNIKISFRSKGTADVNRVAAVFGGGGHPNAAGARIRGTMDDIAEKVWDALMAECKIMKCDK